MSPSASLKNYQYSAFLVLSLLPLIPQPYSIIIIIYRGFVVCVREIS